jgi:hypothetical protein
MGTGIYSAVYEAKAIRESERALCRKEGVAFAHPGINTVRKALSSLLVTVSSFLF